MALTKAQSDGVTKARLIRNIASPADDQLADNDAYLNWVAAAAGIDRTDEAAWADSYADQHAGKDIAALEAELAEKLAPADA